MTSAPSVTFHIELFPESVVFSQKPEWFYSHIKSLPLPGHSSEEDKVWIKEHTDQSRDTAEGGRSPLRSTGLFWSVHTASPRVCRDLSSSWLKKKRCLSNGDEDIENKLVDTVWEGEGGTNWESIVETCTLSYVKQIASGNLLCDSGSSTHCSVTT